MPWEKVHLFWCDERLVSPKKTREQLRDGERGDDIQGRYPRVECAPRPGRDDEPGRDRQRGTRRSSRGSSTGNEGWPLIDLAILGVGPDGHTASLFPGSRALDSKSWVAPVMNPGMEPRHPRVTLTLEIINRTRCAMFMVVGADKEEVVEKVLAGESLAQPIPAAMVRPLSSLVWFILEYK